MNISEELKEKTSKPVKVLIVGAQFSNSYGSGIFTTHMFANWDKDNLATISSRRLLQNWEKCSSHYCVGDKEICMRKPLNRFREPKSSGQLTVAGEKQESISNKTKSKSRYPSFRKIGQKIVSLLGGKELFLNIVVSKELLLWINEFKPDVLYGVCSSYESIEFLRKLHDVLPIPLVLHLMDDWPTTLYNRGLVKYTIRPRYGRAFNKLIQQADVVIGICETMAKEYQTRYKRLVISFPIPIDIQPYNTIYRTEWKIRKPFRIRYGGRVGWAIKESLGEFARVVEQLNKEGYEILFEIATNQIENIPSICKELDSVKIVKLSPLHELPKISAECDLHLICYDFDEYSINQAKYSMPGKLPACMASGTPILVYAPSCLPVSNYVKNENWGVLVSNRNSGELANQIKRIVNDKQIRKEYGEKARKLAYQKHDAKMVSTSFAEVFAVLKKN